MCCAATDVGGSFAFGAALADETAADAATGEPLGDEATVVDAAGLGAAGLSHPDARHARHARMEAQRMRRTLPFLAAEKRLKEGVSRRDKRRRRR